MFAMSKFYDLTNNDLMNSLKFIDELEYRTREKDVRYNVTDNGLELSVDLPGVKTEDLDINVVGRELIIEGKLRDKAFSKKYTISKNFDLSTAAATHEHGVLTLRFEKAAENKPNKIKINIS